ncbi:MAG: hypothetical protein ACOCT7_00265, partial [Candidatus Saliniplasma sp.]
MRIEKENKKAVYLSFILVALLLISALSGSVMRSSNISSGKYETPDADIVDHGKNSVNSDSIDESGDTDVPTWEIGSTWTYYQQLWQNDSDSDDYMYIEEEITYTVEAVEYYTY